MHTGECTIHRQLLADSIQFEQSRPPLNPVRRIHNYHTIFYDRRFEKPSAIQQRAITPCCKGLYKNVF